MTKTLNINSKEASIKKRNIRVYNDNLRIILKEGGNYHCDSGTAGYIERDGMLQSGTIMYDKPFSVADVPCLPDGEHTSISVVKGDCLDIAHSYIDLKSGLGYSWDRRVAVLNCASYSNPGGGVRKGAIAQEEDLFRRTNLFRSLYQYADYAPLYGLQRKYPQYPLNKHFGGVYSSNVTVFRTTSAKGYKLMEEPFCIDVISAASVYRPELDVTRRHFADKEDIATVKDTIRTIYRIGLVNHVQCLILCPLGCGAFKNPPYDVAKFFKEILEEQEFKDKYEAVVFTILDKKSIKGHKYHGNFIPFFNVFNADKIEQEDSKYFKRYYDNDFESMEFATIQSVLQGIADKEYECGEINERRILQLLMNELSTISDCVLSTNPCREFIYVDGFVEAIRDAEYVDMSNIQVVEDEDAAYIFLKLNHFNCEVEITNRNAAFVVIDNAGIAPESVDFWVSCLASGILWIDRLYKVLIADIRRRYDELKLNN